MNSIKLLSILALVLMFNCQNALAQDEETPSVQWSALGPPSAIHVGDTIEIIFSGKIPENNHVYSNKFVCEIGPLPSEFKFEENESYELVGSPLAVGTENYYDDIFECNIAQFSDLAEFRQRVVIKSWDPIIRGKLDYQMCLESGRCILKTYEFDVKSLGVHRH